MRSIVVALSTIAALACGVLSCHLHRPELGLILLAALALTALIAGLRVARGGSSAWRSILVAACLAAIALLRGLSVGAGAEGQAARVADRAPPGPRTLRSFDVVGASEPGPRCRLRLREAGASRFEAAEIVVSARPEACPRASGERVAVFARSLGGDGVSWLRDGWSSGRVRDLGRGPTVWSRDPGPRGHLARIGDRYWGWVAGQRQRAWSLTRGDSAGSLAVAVGLGLREALEPGRRRELRAAGLGHLIAVSGLHVAVAALWLQALARRVAVAVGGSPRRACVLAWLPLLAYVGLTGAAPSAVRAAVMLIAIDLAVVVGRPSHGPTLLAVTAAGMLMVRPDWLSDPGFQLSMAAMAAIVTAPRELGLLRTSWRISWATAPVSVVHFGLAPMHGLLGNALALPIFALLMPAALLGSLSLGWLGADALIPARILAEPILDLAALLAELPAAGPGPLLVLASLAVLARLGLGRARSRRVGAWLPPGFASVLTMVTCAALLLPSPKSEAAAPGFDWIAIGSVHSRSLLVRDRSRPRRACLYRPTLSAGLWVELFDRVGVDGLSRLDARLPPSADEQPRPASADPRTRALATRLREAGRPVGSGPGDCEPPPRARVRAALRACRGRQGGRGRALVRARGEGIACRVEDRWVELTELEP